MCLCMRLFSANRQQNRRTNAFSSHWEYILAYYSILYLIYYYSGCLLGIHIDNFKRRKILSFQLSVATALLPLSPAPLAPLGLPLPLLGGPGADLTGSGADLAGPGADLTGSGADSTVSGADIKGPGIYLAGPEEDSIGPNFAGTLETGSAGRLQNFLI